MRDGAILSGLLHGFVLLLLLIGLPDLFRREIEPPSVIPIDVINISHLTQAPALKVKPKNDGPKEEVKEKPEPPKPTPVAAEIPEPEKKPEPTPEPELTMDDLLAPMIEEKKKKETPKETPKEKPKKKAQKKKKQNNMAKLLKNLDKIESSSDGPTQKEQDENSTADQAGTTIGDLSVTELDLIRRQLAACWNVPAGARDAKDLCVSVKIEVNPDATVKSVVVVGSSGNKAADDSARRAVLNPKCSPLKLPLDRYDQWKIITVDFNPQHIL